MILPPVVVVWVAAFSFGRRELLPFIFISVSWYYISINLIFCQRFHLFLLAIAYFLLSFVGRCRWPCDLVCCGFLCWWLIAGAGDISHAAGGRVSAENTAKIKKALS